MLFGARGFTCAFKAVNIQGLVWDREGIFMSSRDFSCMFFFGIFWVREGMSGSMEVREKNCETHKNENFLENFRKKIWEKIKIEKVLLSSFC